MSKKKREPSYTINIYHEYDEKTNSNVVVFLVQTTKIFVSFRYEILLEDVIEADIINIKIKGLHVPELLMANTGSAQGKLLHSNLNGKYKLLITKQDNATNEFEINITETNVEILKAEKSPFILISNEPVHNN